MLQRCCPPSVCCLDTRGGLELCLSLSPLLNTNSDAAAKASRLVIMLICQLPIRERWGQAGGTTDMNSAREDSLFHSSLPHFIFHKIINKNILQPKNDIVIR